MGFCEEIYKRWRHNEKRIIGVTRLKKPIFAYRTGKNPVTLIVASVHAREYVTSSLVTELFCDCGLSFDVVPILNEDGVDLCLYGVDRLDNEWGKRLVKINGSKDFSLWKANAFAVDINVNFDAEWGRGKSNVKIPSPANYIGDYPESEPETKAIAGLLRRNTYAQVVAYHAKGEVVYHGFLNNHRHYDLAKRYAESIGYDLTTAEGSTGGLKDYFDVISDGLGLTVEVGKDVFPHPYPLTEIDNLTEQHKESVKILYDNGLEVARRIFELSDR